ncbi:MAG: heavy metal translocating P-type ATPase, partial [Rhodospirillales bacterium]|nr:heavy metal translocating P-type ATPase [Rhodospirillales bacterium]
MSDLASREGAGEIRSWHVRGMDCPSCVSKVERAVSRLPGLGEVSVNLMAEMLTARLAPEADPSSVAAAVAALGYKASPQSRPLAAPAPAGDDESARQHGHDHGGTGGGTSDAHAHGAEEDEPGIPWWRTGKAKLVWLLGVLVIAAWIGSRLFAAEAYWIFVVATLVAVVPFGRRALALARAGSPFSIEMLMCVAALGAVMIGAAEEAAIVVLLFAIGELLENVAAGRARAGIRALANLIPRTARVEREDNLAELPADSLRPGDVVQVRPGDRIPCDGLIVDGQSSVDESPVTGESVPVERGPGEVVVAASINTTALLRVRVTAA